jgi:hypothetical protein
MAQFWQAKYITLFSEHGVEVVQVLPTLEPYLWLNHSDEYYRSFEFVITDETAAKGTPACLDPERIVSRFGAPDETFACGSNTVRVYRHGQMRDCFPQFFDFRKSGAEATFLAAELPIQVGAVAGQSRVAEGCAPGHVTYGPYTRLYPGAYRGRIYYEAKAATSQETVGKWDVLLQRRGRNIVVQKGRLTDQSDGITFAFETDSDCVVEVRTFYSGAGKLIVHKLTLQRTR